GQHERGQRARRGQPGDHRAVGGGVVGGRGDGGVRGGRGGAEHVGRAGGVGTQGGGGGAGDGALVHPPGEPGEPFSDGNAGDDGGDGPVRTAAAGRGGGLEVEGVELGRATV